MKIIKVTGCDICPYRDFEPSSGFNYCRELARFKKHKDGYYLFVENTVFKLPIMPNEILDNCPLEDSTSSKIHFPLENSETFYNLMQDYRNTPIQNFTDVKRRYEAVITFLNGNIE